MQFLRTLFWVILTAVVVSFIAMNWGQAQDVVIWPSPVVAPFKGPIGLIAAIFFLSGFVPMWVVYRGMKWRLNRRIKQLEDAQQLSDNAATPPIPPHS